MRSDAPAPSRWCWRAPGCARGSMAAVKKAVQAMVADKRAITADEAKAAMQDLFAGTSTQAQTGAFLTSLQVCAFDARSALCVMPAPAPRAELAKAQGKSCRSPRDEPRVPAPIGRMPARRAVGGTRG